MSDELKHTILGIVIGGSLLASIYLYTSFKRENTAKPINIATEASAPTVSNDAFILKTLSAKEESTVVPLSDSEILKRLSN